MSSPAPLSRTTETATCATTSARWSRWRRRVPLARPAPDVSQLPSVPSRASLGANERMSATASVSTRVKPSTMPSRRISFARGE